MGTIFEWLSVLLSGGIYGVAMALWNPPRKVAVGARTSYALHVVGWMFAGLLFGIATTLGWRRALHTPIVFITVAALAEILISGLIERRRTRDRTQVDSHDSLTIPSHLR